MSRRKKLATALLAIILIGLLLRLTITIFSAETGLEVVARHWRRETIERLGWARVPIDVQNPNRQAEFWLETADKIVAAAPDRADVAMGAAWVLDKPCVNERNPTRFASAPPYVKPPDEFSDMQEYAWSVEYREAQEKKSFEDALAFEEACGSRCLELAARATELEPDNVNWWRMRALLQFRAVDEKLGSSLLRSSASRGSSWRSVLSEGARRDPDNALYDYLAAIAHWEESGSYEQLNIETESNDDYAEWEWVVTDSDSYQAALDSLDRAQKKSYLSLGELGLQGIPQFLDLAPISKREQFAMIDNQHFFLENMFLQSSVSSIFFNVFESEEPATAQQKLAFFKRRYEYLTLVLQSPDLNTLHQSGGENSLRVYLFNGMAWLESEPGIPLFEPAEYAELLAQEHSLRERTMAMSNISQVVDTGIQEHPEQLVLYEIFISTALLSVIVLTAIGLLASIFFRLFRGEQVQKRTSWLRHGTTWGLGHVCVFIAAGMSPAQMISTDVRDKILFAAWWCLAIVLAFGAVLKSYRYLRSHKYQFSLRFLLVVMALLSVVFTLLPLGIATFWELDRQASTSLNEFMTEPLGWQGFPSVQFSQPFKLEDGTWSWACVQWLVHQGALASVAVSLFFILSSYLPSVVRRSRERHQSKSPAEFKQCCVNISAYLKRTCFFAAVFWLLVYLWIAPLAISANEQQFQNVMVQIRTPAERWKFIDDARRKVEATPAIMEAIREEVEQEMQPYYDELERMRGGKPEF